MEVALSGAAGLTLDPGQAAAKIIRFTGVLSANVTVRLSLNREFCGLSYTFHNACTGGFSVTVAPIGGTGVALSSGANVKLWYDGSTLVREGADFLVTSEGALSVKDFGAEGDGATDDTDAFVEADALGGTIFVPAGTYLLTRTLRLTKAYFIGSGWGTSVVSPKSRLLFQGLGDDSAITTTQAETLTRTTGLENLFIMANSWTPVTGCTGYGLDFEQRVTCRNVYVEKFKKSGLILRSDGSNGPYGSLFEGCSTFYSGEHGTVLGTGANACTFINHQSKYSGAPSYGVAPTVPGVYDGFFLSRDGLGNPHSVTPYNPQSLMILGGDCSYNSRYGWNLSQGRNLFCAPGYAELNLVNNARVGDLTFATVFFQTLGNDVAGLLLDLSTAADSRKNAIWVGGTYMGGGHPNQYSYMLSNLQSWLMEETAGDADAVYFLPTPASKLLELVTAGTAELRIGAGTHYLGVLSNQIILPDVYYHRGATILRREAGAAAPVSGTYAIGDFVWNEAPSNGEPLGWICVSAGSPGTFIPVAETPITTTTTAASITLGTFQRNLLVNHPSGTVAVTLPATQQNGWRYSVTDIGGAAATFPITITPSSGTINGAANYVISTNNGSVTLMSNGTNFFIMGTA